MERDDQAELIRKYYRGQLSESEQDAFNQLNEDPDFQEELIRFTLLHNLLEVQSLQEEATSILSGLEIPTFPASIETSFPLILEEENTRVYASMDLGKQRQENRGDPPNENQVRLNEIFTKLGDEHVSLENLEQEGIKKKTKNAWNWLAAAVTISIVCLAGLWWLGQNNKEEIKVSTHQKQADSTRIAHAPQVTKDQSKTQIDIPKSKIDSLKINIRTSRRFPDNEKLNIRSAERQLLVKSNFVADSLPSETLEDLEVPDALYKNQQHENAIVEYKKVLDALKTQSPELASRGLEDSSLTAFLANYYLGQSYFLLNQTPQTIAALKSARKQAPNSYWKGKTEWYLALVYLQAGQIQEARMLLHQVAGNRDAGAYQQKARQLNNKLRDP